MSQPLASQQQQQQQQQQQPPKPLATTTRLEDDVNYSKLPRSVTWRLLLGLLRSPTGTSSSMDVSLDQVLDCNDELLQEEVSHYEQLQALYQPHLKQEQSQQYQGEAVAVLSDHDSQGQDATATTTNISLLPQDPLNASAAAFDPLTAMMMEQQAQESRRQELDLRYRKEKARRNRGLSEPGSKAVVEDDGDAEAKKLDRETVRVMLAGLPKPTGLGSHLYCLYWQFHFANLSTA
jgi:hypothetical protein